MAEWRTGNRCAVEIWPTQALLEWATTIFYSDCRVRYVQAREALDGRARQLDVEVLYIQGIVFNELAPGLDVLAHQRAEDAFSLCQIL